MNKTEENNSLRVIQRTDNARFEALMKAADFRRQVREARMSFERQVTLAAWALMLGIATTLKTSDFCLALAAALLVIVLHAGWVWRNFVVSDRDARMMWADYDRARTVARLPHQPHSESEGAPLSILRRGPRDVRSRRSCRPIRDGKVKLTHYPPGRALALPESCCAPPSASRSHPSVFNQCVAFRTSSPPPSGWEARQLLRMDPP